MAADYKIKKIYVCSPYAGPTEEAIVKNTDFAKKACRYVLGVNETEPLMPIAPHLLFPQFMDDSVPKERGIALNFGLNLIMACEEMWVFGDTMSEGMAAEIAFAQYIPFKRVRFFKEVGETFEEIKI